VGSKRDLNQHGTHFGAETRLKHLGVLPSSRRPKQ